MERVKNVSLFIMVGLIVTLLANWLKSEFITKFLEENLITLLIALVAINTTTLSVVLTKIREIVDRLGGDFTRTAKEMKSSIAEQVILIILAVSIQTIGTSSKIYEGLPLITFITSVLLVAIFSNALYILYDTANSVFVILKFENDKPHTSHDEQRRTNQKEKDLREIKK